MLEQLLASEEDQAKVRTLDMEIHFGFRAASERAYDSWSEKKRLEREISIIEGLNKRFMVTGSTLEVYRQGWNPQGDCPQQQCSEPIVHLEGGFSPQMFALSYVNREIVGYGPGSPQGPTAPAVSGDDERPPPPPAVALGWEAAAPAPWEPAAPAPPAPAPRPKPKKPTRKPLVTSHRACSYVYPNAVSSRPGPPCIPPAKWWPYTSNLAWRTLVLLLLMLFIYIISRSMHPSIYLSNLGRSWARGSSGPCRLRSPTRTAFSCCVILCCAALLYS